MRMVVLICAGRRCSFSSTRIWRENLKMGSVWCISLPSRVCYTTSLDTRGEIWQEKCALQKSWFG